jgi:hypothetical protein
VLQCTFSAQARYKTDSAAKYLIFNDLVDCVFFGQRGQALDFSGFGGHRRAAINKVIHMNLEAQVKPIPIKDLSGISSIHLNFSA